MVDVKRDIRKKILIIDDNANYRSVLHIFLSPYYDVLEAFNGSDGFCKVQREIPDVVICDLCMPLEDGFSFCRSIRNCQQTCFIPVVLLTSVDRQEGEIPGLELGADDYIVKPFNPDLLLARIKNLIAGRALLKTHYRGGYTEVEEGDTNCFTNRVIEQIEQHLSDPEFGVKKLADMLCVSSTSLYRKVKREIQMSPIELIRTLRLKKASVLLKSKIVSVSEVAEAVGYNDLSSFRRHFVEYFGKVPSVYAKDK